MWGALLSGLGGFGKAIGGGVAKVGKGIGSGIVKGGQKIGSEFKERIGEMREGGGSGAAPMTPGFNPGASMPKLGGNTVTVPHRGSGGYDTVFSDGSIASTMERRPAMPGAQDRAVEMLMGRNGGNNEPSRLPMPALDLKPPMPLTQMQQSGHPPLTGFDTNTGRLAGSPPPRMAPPLTGVNPMSGQMDNQPPMIRDSMQVTDTAPRLAPSPVPSLAAPQMSAPRDASFDSREGVPLPGRPNRGGPVPYSDYEAGKYDAWAKHAKRDADGNFDPKGGTNRNWKSILQNGLLGAAQYADSGDWGKMLGGAIGGVGGSAVNPQAGYEHVWDAGHGARMMEDQGRQDAEVERQRKQRMGGLAEREANADVGLKESALKRAQGRRVGEATWGTYDQETGQPIWQRPAGQATQARQRLYNVNGTLVNDAGQVVYQGQGKPMTMQDALAEEDVADNATVEQIANDSYQGRGGDNYLIGKMPPQYQQALRNAEPNLDSLPTEYRNALANPGAVDAELLTKAEQARNTLVEKHNQMRIAAQNELQQMRQQEMNSILRDTKATRQSNAAKRRIGGGSNAPATNGGANGQSAKLSDLKKYLQ